ncbi:MAG: phosphoglucomutase/phosphomannomutase family protein [Candidatus Limnocylindrales bacterium]
MSGNQPGSGAGPANTSWVGGSAAAEPTRIVFGTDGWRAKTADEYTFLNVRRCAQAVAEWVVARGQQSRGVVMAYDRRFASEHFAAAAAEVVLAHNIPVAFAMHAVPTQMSSFEVVQRHAAAGIVITASHNPWTDNGFKIKSPTGAAAGPEMLTDIEARIAAGAGKAIEIRPFADAEAAGMVERYDSFDAYREFIGPNIDLDRLRAADVDVLVDPLFGSGATWIPRLLAGGRIRTTELHSERNPYFGGINPEPIPPNVDEALRTIAAGRYDLGLLLDGDADRAGAADERGTFITTLQMYALLMYYLIEHRGLKAPVVKTVNETSMAERLGERYGVAVHEVPVGFKYVGPEMIATGAMMGGEESGGYGFGMHLPERDGIFADLMVLDLFLREKDAGRWPASRAIAHLHEIAGPSSYRRVDIHIDRAVYPALKDRLLIELPQKAPSQLAGRPVVRTQTLSTNDGFKFFADDGSWLLVRFSGTEPLVRVYTEAASAAAVDANLAAGQAMVGV